MRTVVINIEYEFISVYQQMFYKFSDNYNRQLDRLKVDRMK